MQGKPDRFTMVFEGDLREFKGNPLYAVTDWGVPASVGVGDAFARLDAYEAALREIANGEVTVWDEDLQENIIVWMDEEEMQIIARKALETK